MRDVLIVVIIVAVIVLNGIVTILTEPGRRNR